MTWEGLTPPYATIVADPPWPYEGDRPPFGPTSHGDQGWSRKWSYSLMSLGEIAALPVQDLAQPGAHLYLWTTNRYLWDARDVALGWGFTPSKVLVWCKEPMGLGLGGLFAQLTEFIVFAQADRPDREIPRAGALVRAARQDAGLTRAQLHVAIRGGKPTAIVNRWEDDDSLPNEQDWAKLQEVLPALRGVKRPHVPPPEPRERNRVDRNWWTWKRGPHSAKPPAFLDLVEQVSPAPRVELFARAQRLGWDSWGWGYEGAAS
jgi:N6-adenosine-specific RNA methylase IME4